MHTLAAMLRRALTGRNVLYALGAYCLWAYFDTSDRYPEAPRDREIGWMLILIAGFLCGRYYERHRRALGDLPPSERREQEERERLIREHVERGLQYAPKTKTTNEDDDR